MKAISSFSLIVAALLASSTYAQEEGRAVQLPSDDRAISFAKDVLPVLQKNCLACHNKSETEGELIMETTESLLEGGDSGPAVVAGDADESLLFQLAAHQTEPVMPPVDNDVGAKPLSPQELGLLKRWIDQGAKADDEENIEEIAWKKVPDSYAHIFALELSPDGHWLAAGRGNELFVYSVTGKRQTAKLVDPEISETHPNSAHLDVVQSLAWSPDQNTIVSGGFRCIKVWQRNTPKFDDFQPTDETRQLLGAEFENASSYVVTADQKRLAAILDDKVQLIELPSRKVLKVLTKDVFSTREIASATRQVGLAKERLRVANEDVGSAKKRKEDDEKNQKKNEDDLKKAEEEVPKKKKVADDAVAAAKKKQDEVDTAKQLVATRKKELADAAEPDKKAKQDALKTAEQELKNRENELKKAKENEKKRRLEFEGSEKVVKLGKEAVERAKKAVQLRTEELQAAEEEAKTLAANLKTSEEGLAKTKEHAQQTNIELKEVRLVADGWQFAVVDAKQTSVAYFDLANGDLVSTQSGVDSGDGLSESWSLVRTIGWPNDPDVFADRVTSLAFSHDGSLLATGGGEPSRTGEVQLWNTADWTLAGRLDELHSDVVYDMQFSPQDDTLATCGSDRMMKTIDPKSIKPIRNFEGHTGHVLGVSWRADGRTLATAGADKVVKIWDAKEGTQKKTVSGFKSEVTAVRYLGLNDRLVFSTGDGKVQSRDSKGNGKPGFSGFSDYVHKVSSDQSGKIIAAAGQDRVIRIWNEGGKLLVDFK